MAVQGQIFGFFAMDSSNKKPGMPADLSTIELCSYPETEPSSGKPEGATLLPETDLRDTFGAFNERIQKRKRDAEIADSAASKATKARHALILEAMMSIRRSLSDVVRVNLGERFSLSLEADDWQGWPRLTISLCDSLLPTAEYPYFAVTANDFRGKASIDILITEPKQLESLSLTQPGDLRRLPTTLKRCVRSFLDLIGDIVIDLESGDVDPAEQALAKTGAKDFNEHKDESADAISGDLFSDEEIREDLFDALPAVDTVDCLPDSND